MVPEQNTELSEAEKRRAYHKAWRDRNKDRVAEYQRSYKERHPNNRRSTELKTKFGITADEYDSMLENQNGKCAICGITPDLNGKALCVDHDRRCCPTWKSCGKCVRGLLCSKCNSLIAFANEDPEIIRAMVTYIEEHNGE